MSDGLTSPHDLRTTTIGRQQIILGDCRAVLRTLPTAAVDVIVTSPPYNIGVDYHQHDDHQPRETYLAGLAKCFAELHRVLKPAGSFFLNIGTGTKDDFTLPFAIIERALIAGFVPQNYIAWVKAIAAANGVIRGHNKPVNSPLFLTRMHEIVLHLTKSGDVRLSKLAIGVPFADKSNIERRGHAEDKRDRGNTWFLDYDTVQSSKVGKFDHPAGFPAELPTWCIRLHGLRPDLTVLDPFLGAGTTLVAAQALGCHGVGIEIDPQYVETAVQRLRTTTPAETQPLRRADTAERPVVSEATDRESRRHQVVVDTRSSPQDLLRAAQQAGAQVRLHGGQVEFSSAHGLSPELRTLLRAHRDEVWTHLGGAALDAPPLALLHQLGVQLLVPTTMREAVAAVAQVERDSDQYTAEDRLIGFDIETSALPGLEVRPFTKLKRNGTPAKVQPTFKGTAALDPFRSRIRLAQLYGGGTHAVVLDLDLLSRLEVGKLLTQLFARHTVVAHNVSFELRFLGAAGIAVPQYEDTMQAAGLLLGVRQRSLEAAAGAYLGLAVPKSLQVSDWSAPVLSPGQHAYAALDAIIAFKLWLKLYPELLQKDRVTAYNLQRDATRVAVAMVDRGITLDRARHQQQIEEWRTTLAAANRNFVAKAMHDPPQTPEQVRAFLKLTLRPDVLAEWPTTAKTGAMSTRAPDLKKMVVTVPAIRDLLEIRATQTLLTNFGDELLNKISARTGRLHPGLNIASTKAGRSSSNNPNVQQIPKHKSPAMRAAMVAAAGYRFIIADYNAMELRAAAEVSNDQAMRQDFADGVDPHRRQAAAMLGIPEDQVTANQRDAAKPINFGTIYGAGPVGLAASAWNGYGILLTPDEAGAGRQHFLSRYYTFARWMHDHHARCSETGRIDIGCFGRVIEAAWETPKHSNGHTYRAGDDDEYADEDDSEFFDEWISEGWAASVLKYTLCCNAPVQGSCADIGMLALLLFDAGLRQEGIDGGPVLFIHDEIVAEVATDQADRAAQILRTSMEQAFNAVFPGAPVNNLVEIAIRKSWGKSP